MSDEARPSDTLNLPELGPEPRGLRVWFCLYLAWLGALTWLALWAQSRHATGVLESERIWLGAVYVFYLSLCCTFFPAPTAWIVMLLASNDVRLMDSAPARVLTVTTIGAFATAVANLNEYHLWTVLFRFRTLGRVRSTRFFQWARDRFFVSPFAVLVGFSFIPIPVDVVRWLAVACRYSRVRFFFAYFTGRWVRYFLLTLSTIWLDLSWWHILLVQGALVLIAAAHFAVAWGSRRARESDRVNKSDTLYVQS